MTHLIPFPRPAGRGRVPLSAATNSRPPTGGGDREKAARQGVLSALRPAAHPADGRRVVAMLHITAPSSSAVPTATSTCACGHNRSAVGHRRVLALIEEHTAHRTTCTLLHAEGESAA